MFICFFMILVCIASFSFVSAQDSDVNDTTGDLDENILSEESLSVSGEDDGGLSTSSLTFSDLASSIASTSDGDTLYLENNYTYVNSSDNNYSDGIGILKSITINGNGNVLDGNFESTILDISSSNLVLKNIIFKKGVYDVGAALYIRANAHVDIINCTFKENVANNGVVFLEKGAYANISDCTFKSNYLNEYGVIYSQINASFCVYNSVFRENTADMGVIMVYNQTNCNISGSVFANNTVRVGVIYMNKGSSGNIYDCIFENHTVTHGVIYLANYFDGKIYSCNFTNNYADYGIIYRGSDSYSYIKNCTFEYNEADQGIIYSPTRSNGNIELCTFQYNFAYNYIIYRDSSSKGNLTQCF